MATSDSSEIQASPADASLGVEASTSVAQTRRPSSRRLLPDDQKREVIRLYSETTTPVPEMAKRFGIGESSLYRLVQQHGVPRRGSNPGGTQAIPPEEQQSEGSTAAGTPATRPQPEKRSGRGPSNTLPLRASRRQGTPTLSRQSTGPRSGRAGASRACFDPRTQGVCRPPCRAQCSVLLFSPSRSLPPWTYVTHFSRLRHRVQRTLLRSS
jgi:transposase-like protein